MLSETHPSYSKYRLPTILCGNKVLPHPQKLFDNETLRAICYHLYNLKNVKQHSRRSVTFDKVAGLHQIARSITYVKWNLFTVGSMQFSNYSTIASLEANHNMLLLYK